MGTGTEEKRGSVREIAVSLLLPMRFFSLAGFPFCVMWRDLLAIVVDEEVVVQLTKLSLRVVLRGEEVMLQGPVLAHYREA